MSSTTFVSSDDESLNYLFEESLFEDTTTTSFENANSSTDDDDLTVDEVAYINELCEELEEPVKEEKDEEMENINVSESTNNTTTDLTAAIVDINAGLDESEYLNFDFVETLFAPSDEIYTMETGLNELDLDQAIAFLDENETVIEPTDDVSELLFNPQPAVVDVSTQTVLEEPLSLPTNENSLILSDEELQNILDNFDVEAIFNNTTNNNVTDIDYPSTSINMSQLELVPQNVSQHVVSTEMITETSVSETVIDVPQRNLTQESFANKPHKVTIKRVMPVYTSLSYDRADRYWEVIVSNPAFKKLANNESQIMSAVGGYAIDTSIIKRNVVASLLPNYVDISDFENFQDEDGWKYKVNKRRAFDDYISLRWCNQKQNFYQPLVIRYKKNGTKKPITQNLCPYCPYTKGMDLNTIFHSVDDSSYMHHVCKDHGVYTTGNEMPIPVFGKTAKGLVAVCGICGNTCNLSVDVHADNLNNCLISYFRHCFDKHKNKRQNRDANEIKREAQEIKANRHNLILENLIVSKI